MKPLPCRYSLPTIFVIFFSGLAVDALGLWLSCLIFGAFVLASSLIWYTALQASAAAGSIFVVGLLAQGMLGVGGESLFVAQKALLGASFGSEQQGDERCKIRTGVAFGVSQTTAKLSQGGHSRLQTAFCRWAGRFHTNGVAR